jgi:hypothetical protein
MTDLRNDESGRTENDDTFMSECECEPCWPDWSHHQDCPLYGEKTG